MLSRYNSMIVKNYANVIAKYPKIIEKSVENPFIYGYSCGIIGGIYGINSFDNEPEYKEIGAIFGSLGGFACGYTLTPLIAYSFPIIIPVGAYAVYDHYKTKQS